MDETIIKVRPWEDRKRMALLAFSTMSPEERVEVFQELDSMFCDHCGVFHADAHPAPGGRCQCWNDE